MDIYDFFPAEIRGIIFSFVGKCYQENARQVCKTWWENLHLDVGKEYQKTSIRKRIYSACKIGDLDTLILLTQHYIPRRIINKAMAHSVENKHYALIDYLIVTGVEMHKKFPRTMDLMDTAAETCDENIIDLCLDLYRTHQKYWKKALDNLVLGLTYLGEIDLFIKYLNLYECDLNVNRLLYMAGARGKKEIIKYLMDNYDVDSSYLLEGVSKITDINELVGVYSFILEQINFS